MIPLEEARGIILSACPVMDARAPAPGGLTRRA